MANEINTTAAAEFQQTEVVERMIIRAAYSAGKIAPLVRVVDISGQPTNKVDFPKDPLLTASTLTEGTDLANTAFNPTEVSCTAVEVGLMVTLLDFLANASIVGPDHYANQLGLAAATKMDLDLAAEFADYATSVGTSGANLTETNWLESLYNLENGNAQGPYVAVLHPIQLLDLRQSIVSSAGAVWGASAGPDALVMEAGSFYGVATITSTNCASVASDADRQGAMFPLTDQAGVVLVMKRGLQVEPQRDASLRGTELVCTVVYGDECVNTAANGGIKIVTDHE